MDNVYFCLIILRSLSSEILRDFLLSLPNIRFLAIGDRELRQKEKARFLMLIGSFSLLIN